MEALCRLESLQCPLRESVYTFPDIGPYHKTASYTMACRALHASNFPFTMRSWANAEWSS